MTKFKNWIKAAGSRALRTFLQTAIAAIGTAVALEDVNWFAVLSMAALAAILSMMTSAVSNLPELEEKEKKENGN